MWLHILVLSLLMCVCHTTVFENGTYTHQQGHTSPPILIAHRCTIIDYLTNTNLQASTDNELLEDGVTAPKHVRAILM